MSFLFGSRPQLSSAEKIDAAMTEVELISDMYNRLSQSCLTKCIPPEYREGDLNKGESVCIDRCVAKFFEVNLKVSDKMQGEAAMKEGAGGAVPGGGMFGK